MQLRQLGSSDIKITPVVFGAWAVGGWMWGGNDEAEQEPQHDHGESLGDGAAGHRHGRYEAEDHEGEILGRAEGQGEIR